MLTILRSLMPLFVALCACSIAAVAMGGGTAVWVELDNSANPANGNPTGLDDGSYDGTVYRTFDLYVVLPPPWFSDDPAENPVSAISFLPNAFTTGLLSDGLYLQVPVFGSDRVIANESFVDFNDQVYFDCAVAIEDSPINFSEFAWDADSVSGAWSVTPGNPAVFAPDGLHVFVARVTVSADASELGGQCYVGDQRIDCSGPFGCGPGDAVQFYHDIPNAFQELECLGDITWDGVVDAADLGRLVRSFGSGWGDAGFNPRADFTRDGVVDAADLARLIARFGESCD